MNNPGQAYFDANYPNYEAQNSPAKLAFYLDLVQRHTPVGRPLFELGTGLGLFMQLASAHYPCWGCDPNSYAVECTARKAPQAQLFTGSFETLPSSGIATVVSWDVLEHIPELDQALETIYQRLEPGGHLVGVVPVYDGPLGFLVRRLDHDPTHVWKCSRRWWLERLNRAGFHIVTYGGILRKLLAGRHYLHWTAPQWLWRACGCALYFVAQKADTSTENSPS